jgi:hypothetical protein
MSNWNDMRKGVKNGDLGGQKGYLKRVKEREK